MTDINALGTGVVTSGETTLIALSSAVQMEGVEHSPYANAFVTPGIPGSGFVAPGGSGGSSGGDGGVSSLLPGSRDLAYTAGDWAVFAFLFQGMAYVEEQPVGAGWADDGNGQWTYTDVDDSEPPVTTQIPWVQATWASQVRTKYWQRYGYWWPPVRPIGILMTDFLVTATFMPRTATMPPGTMVTLSGTTFYPGEYFWDLQTNTDDGTLYYAYPRTMLSGKARVGQQVTL